MNWTRKAAAVAVALFLALPAIAQAQTNLTFGYTAANDILPALVAKEKGIFAKHGLDVTMTRAPVASQLPAALISDSVNIALGTGAGFVVARQGGLDLVIVMGASRHDAANPTVSIITRPDLGIKSPADLKGRRIGVPGLNSALHVTATWWLKLRGVAAPEVNFVEVPFPQMSDLLRGKQVDAVAANEPIRSKILADGTGTILSNYYADIGDGLLSAFLISTRGWAEKNRDAVRAFDAAFVEGTALIAQDDAMAREIEKKNFGANAPRLPKFDPAVTPADLAIYVEMSASMGLVEKSLDVSNVIFK